MSDEIIYFDPEYDLYLAERAARCHSAISSRRRRESDIEPDRRLDDLGWDIFRAATDCGLRENEAAHAAMDGTLRQRERVLHDLSLRAFRHSMAEVPSLRRWQKATPEDPGVRLAFWQSELPHPEFVYFVQSGTDGPVKIGRAKNPQERMRTLQTGSPTDLTLREVVPGDSQLEGVLHRRFEVARIRGEWFGAEYLPLILAYAAGIATAAIECYDGHGAPTAIMAGSDLRTQKEVIGLRREIERMWLDGHPEPFIGHVLRISADELADHLSAMRRSTLYELKRRRKWGHDARRATG